MSMDFLPITLEQGKRRYGSIGFDVIFVTGDPYYDHPLSGTSILSRLIDRKGYRTGIIAQPQKDEDFRACGKPHYLFCVTSGLLDSMLANYTPMLKKREHVLVPERALIAYTQKLKAFFKGSFVVLGGVEATIRRFTHFDYRDNSLRRGIIHDSKADLILFGNAERSLLHLLDQLKMKKADLPKIDGAAFRKNKEDAAGKRQLPSYEECIQDNRKFNLLTRTIYLLPDERIVEKCGEGYVQHNRPQHPLSEEEMDYIYGMEFTRRFHPGTKNLALNEKMTQNFTNSAIIGRGCWGGCNFCVIPLVQGKNIARRSRESILKEIEALYIKGERKINDLTLPTINMYGSYCNKYNVPEKIYSPILEKEITIYNKKEYCSQNCTSCESRAINDELLYLLEDIEKLNKKYGAELEIRSAVRHDMILRQKKLFRKIMQFISRLKIAPEHISDNVLKNMNKGDKKAFIEFISEYREIKKETGTNKNFVPYFVAAHPGCTMKDMEELRDFCKKNRIFTNLTQVFTPTPGTASTAMYYTGENPLTREKVYVPRSFREKKDQKNILLGAEGNISDEQG